MELVHERRGIIFRALDVGVRSRPTQKFNDPIGPFAGYATSDFEQALTGMFLEDALPVSPPPPLRFYEHDSSRGGIQTHFEVLSPEIGQVFFIGDWRTGTDAGNVQVFRVPPTATHLYLGFTDNCGSSLNTVPGCFSDNVGSMTATFRMQQENVDWVEPSLSSAPPGRCCAGMAYDPAAHETVLFGGFGNPEYYGDTWTWRYGWTKLAPAASPSPRQGPGMVWDGAAGNIVLFGGMLSDGAYLNDTWTWDGTTWTQQFPPASPPPRRFDTQSMAYDAATETSVIFGGFDATQNFGDTWTWDGLAKTCEIEHPDVFEKKFVAQKPDGCRRVSQLVDAGLPMLLVLNAHAWSSSTATD